MWAQISAIAWAQMRATRNHLPRTHVGTILIWCVSLLWYGLYAGLAIFLAFALPAIPVQQIRQWMPVALLGVFVFWQLLPLLTLSSGWSLQLNKLQIYPVSDAALFGIEVLLRITSAPEMVLVLLGGVGGLARHPQVPLISAFCLLLYVPFNLFLSLAIREMFLHAFERNRLRELFAVLLVAIALLPQILARTGVWPRVRPYFFAASNTRATPWHEAAMLSLGIVPWPSLGLLALWTAAAYALARWQFKKALTPEESFRAGTRKTARGLARQRVPGRRLGIVDRLFRDPVAAILQKEFHSLVRMPRFRVMFGMACIFGVLVFLPASMNARHHGGGFMANNFFIVVDLYGLLLLSDVLLLNVFGLDRSAAQLYFATPVPLEDVIRAKNVAAVAFVALQSAAVLVAATAMRIPLNAVAIGEAIGASAVATVFFLAVGNLCSTAMPRPIDPKQTFRKQAGGRMQLWFFLCSLGLGILVGFAFLARWAFQNDWAFAGVLAIEFAVGLIFYHFATESAIERAMARREEILEALMKGASPVALGT
jgi:ABC-2 type transport system permease protein